MQFEAILAILGEFGRYQKIQFLFIYLISIPIPWCSLSNTFLSASSDHYCRVFANETFEDRSPLKNCTIPYSHDSGWDECYRYNVSLSGPGDVSPDVCFPRGEKIKCDHGWVYDRSTYENTAVFDFDLVCEKDWMKQLSKSIVGVGQLAGALVLGQLSDILGRKPVFFTGIILIAIIGTGTAFVPWFYLFIVGQFLLSAVGNGVYLTAYVIGVELVGAKYRTFCSVQIMIAFSVGYMALAGIAYGLDGNWRHLQLVIGLAYLVFIPYYWLVPESARWLIQQKKYDKAEKILRKAAKKNKVSLPDNLFEEEKANGKRDTTDNDVTIKPGKKQNTMIDLFKTPNLRCRTLNLCFSWFTCSFVYYGISFNTDTLHGNPYISFLIAGAVEIPGYLSSWWACDKLGRRWSLCLCLILSGLSLVACGLVGNSTATMVLAMVAKLFSSGAFGAVYIFSAEIFPTSVRNAGMGISSTLARIGTVISPYVMLLVSTWTPLPYIIMGATSFLSGILTLLLPETLKQKLPESIEEGEVFGTRKMGKDIEAGKEDEIELLLHEHSESEEEYSVM
ncbi:organic cation transporter protein-like isoform X2 [Ptychodera flava]|uniref:organic cation transporter protein-like isoform X2 n=1 Tax=Ptychodera flava TaxID=63121 RepID=UPI00396A38ED